MSKHKHKTSRAERRRAEREAKKLLRSRDFFNKFLRMLQKLGLVGETENALVVFVVAMSCILDRPLNVFVKGHSSAGKNWLVTRVLKLFPRSAVREITSASEHAWSYSRSYFRHRVVYPYRVIVDREECMHCFDAFLKLVTYSNFKNEVAKTNRRRAEIYHQAWALLRQIEEEANTGESADVIL